MTFSARLPPERSSNRLALAVQHARGEGRPLIDMTESNPTRAGFEYPHGLLAPLADSRALLYEPCPFGLLGARHAAAREFERRGLSVPVDRIVLTASTSEAYSVLFKLLADAGDEVLVPRPSYPLFEHLTSLDLVTEVPYDLEYRGQWSIDLDSVERALTSRSRALLLVSPNNPTGSYVSQEELTRLAAVCARSDVAIIADEVFADYELREGAGADAARIAECRDALVFSLGGLSKSAGLPQLKLGWIAVGGPERQVNEALERLELICDTYLSVSTPVQVAVPALIEQGADVRRQIQARVAANYRHLVTRVPAVPSCTALQANAGWYAVLQVPSFDTEEALVVDLVERHGVVVHPGYFFDFPRESYVVVSLLPPQGLFAEGLDRVLQHFESKATGHD